MADVRKIGNFELLERIGQGGMGSVFRARQVSMDRIVALKVLPPSLAKQPGFCERFLREARASARLNHPYIVAGIDVGQDDGIYYFAMEFVDGLTVKDIIAKGKLSESQVIKIGKAMAQALAHAHAGGILHRDVKPDNILVDKSGTPKLCDLGLARLDSQTEEDKNLTLQGTAVGTPHYISPEQARGMRDLDCKTDFYSLGATLYHMLTGKTMFEGATNVVVMTKHVTDKCPHPGETGTQVSKGMAAVLAKLLTKDRADRYESADKLAEDLDRIAQGKPPKYADLPPAKSPFSGAGAAVKTAATGTGERAAVKKGVATAAYPATERPRTSHREPSVASPGGAGWIVPVALAGLAIVALMVFLGSGKSQPSASNNTDAKRATPAKAARVTAPPAKAATSAVPPQPNLPAKTPEVPRKTDMVGLAPPPPGAPAANPPDKPAPEKTDAPPATPANVAAPETPAAVAAVAAPDPVPEAAKIAPGPELAALITKAAALTVESKFREAAELFKLPAAKMEKLDNFDRELTGIHADGYTGLTQMKQLVADRLKAAQNKIEAKTVLAKAPGGKLVGGDERSLFIKGEGVDLPYKWERLSLEELYNLNGLVLGAVPPGVCLGLGVAGYDQNNEKDDALAKKALAGAPGPAGRKLLELIDVRDKVTIVKKQAVQNAYAEKLFCELDEAMTGGKFGAMAAKAALLRSKYADSDAMKARGAGLDDLLEMAKVAQQAGATAEPGNVALAANGSACTGSPTAPLLIDGITTGYTGSTGFAFVNYPGDLIITLPKVLVLRQMRMLLWDTEPARFYRYAIETSYDGQKFQPLVDHSKDECRNWQQIDFPPRPVKIIRLKGLYNSANSGFHAVELEAYCIPPLQPPVSRPPTDPPARARRARPPPPPQ